MEKMLERLTKIGSFFAEDFQRTFDFIYPCDVDSNETFAEANLTTHFLQALRKAENGLSEGTTWDEFPIYPDDYVLNSDGSKKRIDSVVIEPSEKRITIVESKCLGREERASCINCDDIALDLGRMIKTSNDRDIFPKRVFKGTAKDGTPIRIGVDYNEFTVYGTVVCGVWWPKKHKKTSDEIETMFADGLKDGLRKIDGLVDTSSLEGFFTKAYEIRLPRILLKEKYWKYFVLISGFHISKRNIAPEELGNLDEKIYDFSDARGLLRAAENLFDDQAGFARGKDFGYIVPKPLANFIGNPPSKSPFGFWMPWKDANHPDELYCVCGARPRFLAEHTLDLPAEWIAAEEEYHRLYKDKWRLWIFQLGNKKDLSSEEGRKILMSRIKAMLDGLSEETVLQTD